MRELVSGEIEFVSGGLVQKMGWPNSSNGSGGSSNGGGSNSGSHPGGGTNLLADITKASGSTGFTELTSGAGIVIGAAIIAVTAPVSVPASLLLGLLSAAAALGEARMIVGGITIYASMQHKTS